MNTYRFFFVMFVIGTLLGGSAYSQSMSVDPHAQDFGVATPLIRQNVVVTQCITGDPHEYDRVTLPGEQAHVSVAYITGDPHDAGQRDRMPVVERKTVVMPYLTGDPHYQEESAILLTLK